MIDSYLCTNLQLIIFIFLKRAELVRKKNETESGLNELHQETLDKQSNAKAIDEFITARARNEASNFNEFMTSSKHTEVHNDQFSMSEPISWQKQVQPDLLYSKIF